MVYEYSLGWRLPLIEGERLLNQLTVKIRDRRELTEIFATGAALIQSFMDAERVQMIEFTSDHRGLFVAESSKEKSLLPLDRGQQFCVTPILSSSWEDPLPPQYPIAVDVPTGKILPNSSLRSTAARWLRRQVSLDRQPLSDRYLAQLQRWGVITCIVAPIVHQGQLWGLLLCHHAQARRFHPKQLQILQLAIDQISIAIAQSHLVTRAQIQSEQQAYADPLTGLPNRILLQQSLSLALAKAEEAKEVVAVVFLDLDRFKNINDSLGHAIGDRLLQLVGERLRTALAPEIIFGRWGGDEFTLIVPAIKDLAAVQRIAQQVLDCLQYPFKLDRDLPTLNTNSLYIKGSLGIAIAPCDGADGETLLKHADAALYRAKQQGKNNYEFYNSGISNKAINRLRLENILYQAIDRQWFVLHYQPQIDLTTGKTIGLEALLRCQDGEQKLIDPGDFIPIAEETGSIVRIGEWVLREACQQNKIWQDMGLGYFPIAVNLSVQQLQQPNLIKLITNILDETDLDPGYLEIEITESLAIQDLDLTISMLKSLRNIGVKVSLDDFGTGYSSLAALKYLPLDRLKIDRYFIRDLCAHSIDAGIVKTIINLGHELNLHIIAEGVETSEQLELLRSIGCDAIQGFLVSRPLPAKSLAQTIESGGGWIDQLMANLDRPIEMTTFG
jgi:diguanylate cyclase (GGDEF)-like protein